MHQPCPACGGTDKQSTLLGNHTGPLCARCWGFGYINVPPPVPGLRVPLALLAGGVAVVVAVAVFSPRLRAADEFGWVHGLLVCGCIFVLVGLRLVFGAVIEHSSELHVPTWVGLLILLALLAIPFLVILLS